MVEEQKPKDTSASEDRGSKVTKSIQKGGEKKSQVQKSPIQKRRTSSTRRRTPGKKPADRKESTTSQRKMPPTKVEETKKPEKPTQVTVEEKLPVISTWAVTQAMDIEYSPEQFDEYLNMYEPTMCDIQEGEIIQGTVMGVTKEDVIVDVGFKSEGIIPISEFPEPINVKVGDGIEVYLDAIEDQDGQLVLSKQKADFVRVWGKVKEAHDNAELIEGRIQRRIKGGMVVDLMGVDAFLPGSQIALRQVPDFDALIGEMMEFKVIKLNKARRNIVVSRRSVLEEERLKQKEKLLKEIIPGQIREGVVKNITDFGVFIDLGGVDGLLHITDMSWGRISHPSELVALGDKINVKIIDFDKNTGRISLGLKQLTPYPWEDIETRYPLGKIIKGKVVSITDYGAFVELEKGVEGLIHISEMSWTQHIKHPSKLIAIGDIVEAKVLSVDKDNEKISLGIKQLEPDPWENIEQKYTPGTRVTGRVRNLTAFGAFVELEQGIDGLVHISDLSWTKRIQHPSEVMKKGEKTEVVVLKVDRENRRISLGYKQLKQDPWPDLSRKFAVGKETSGKILRLLDRGVIVDLGENLEGFVPTLHLGKPEISKPSDAFSEGDELPLKVIEFDSQGKKVLLSVEAYYKGKEQKELDAFLVRYPTKTQKVEEIVEERPNLEKEKKADEPESESPAAESKAPEAPPDASAEPQQEKPSEASGEQAQAAPEEMEESEPQNIEAEDETPSASDDRSSEDERDSSPEEEPEKETDT